MMHGQVVSKAEGPSYHGNCHCDLKPVWKRNSLLGDKNKSADHYERQRDMHFLRMNDLKQFNSTLPSGSKLKNYALLPENALSRAILPPLHMRKIRHALLGEPAKIAPLPQQEITHMNDTEWRAEADNLYAKTEKDGKEHLRLYTPDGAKKDFRGISDRVDFPRPKGQFNSLHTHPAEWDSPLSETDIASFLSTKEEIEMGAASSKNIYIVTKKKGWKSISPMQRTSFKMKFQEEVKRIHSEIDISEYFETDFRDVYLKVGETLAKEYGLEYRVIPRAK